MTCKNSHQTIVNTIVKSQAQILTQRNHVMKRSVQNIHEKNTSVDNYDFIMQPYETIPRIKLQKTTHRSRTGVGKLFTRKARFGKTDEASGRTLIGKQGEDLFLEITVHVQM